MRILVNCLACHSGGTRSVAYNLVKSLAKLPGRNDYYVLAPSGAGFEALASDNCVIMALPRPKAYYLWRIWFDQVTIPRLCREHKIDVLFSMINQPARFIAIPQVVAIHQSNLLAAIDYKMTVKDRLFFWLSDLLFRFGKGRVTYFAVQTPVMARNLVRRQGIDPAKIKIIKNGVEANFAGLPADEGIARRFRGADGIKAFCLACYYPSKNLDIFLPVAKLAKAEGVPLKIFITIDERQHPWAAGLLSRIKALGLDDIIINLGYLSRAAAATAYREADLFVLPTLLESFGLIYLEAMELDCPVATSDRDFARDVCGDAAIYFDPKAPEAVLAAIVKIGADERLKEELIKKGRHRLKEYFKSWDEVAEEYIELFKNAAR